MGPQLRSEVERQLLSDLREYAVEVDGLRFDWSETSPEGHRTFFLDGELENWSGVRVIDIDGNIQAYGWLPSRC